MMTDKYIEKFLELYFKGELSQEEKERLFESLRSNPSLNYTVQFVLSHTDPSKAELFLSEKSLMCDTQPLSEHDEILIELYLSGMMSPEEEADFMDKLVSDADLRTNVLALSFLIKAIQKIRNVDNEVLDAARQTTISDVKSLFDELKEEDDDILIDSYLMGSLSDEEKIAFEDRLKTDNTFRERVSAIAFLSKGIKEQQERDVRAIEDARKISKEDVLSTIRELDRLEAVLELPAASIAPSTPSDGEVAVANKSGRIIPIWFRRVAAAAAVIVVIAGVGLDYYNSYVMKDYAGECLAMVETDMSDEIYMKGDGEDVINDLRELFKRVEKKENLSLTISKLEEYYNNATDEYAHDEDAFVDQISLALASAYIYAGQKSKAKDVLNHIVNDFEASPDVKKKAKQLLDSIKKTFIF